MLSRPIALGPLAGAALGDVETGLLVGVPLELLWLGSVNLGAALPVHEALGACAATGGTVLAARALGTGAAAAAAAVAVAVCAPLALAGRRVDRWIETDLNERLAVRADRLCAEGRLDAAARSNLWGLALPFALAAALAPLGALVARSLAVAALRGAPGLRRPLELAWVAFAAFACAAGAKALRARAAPGAYFAALAAATAAGGALLWVRAGVRP
jgi:PTS system mannose-specific IIC component